MPRYYFHVTDDEERRDEQGTSLADLAAARLESLRFAGALLSELEGRNIWSGKDWSMRVSDSDDLTLFTLVFSAHAAPAILGQ
ncbi:MAG: hypothetical protein JWN66_1527 [Sphingomonas bacterium]|jgi:hypothetical protein|uniref:DUF6894 family protein n=1 Tax=Sphingomonas bacterium TaxID=1895847 RepID=UPI002633C79C|nr:hypothetical protein [Sphingomonas bacterium]MDB5704411.1 hypothetical protein [Sphingomonas bacterium]